MVEISPKVEEIGLVDTLNGILAFACKRVQEATGGEYQGFTDWELHRSLHALKANPKFTDTPLRYLDYRSVGDCCHSNALERILFMGGTWGAHHYSISRGRYQITLGIANCNARIESLREEFGDNKVNQLEDMANELIAQNPIYAGLTA